MKNSFKNTSGWQSPELRKMATEAFRVARATFVINVQFLPLERGRRVTSRYYKFSGFAVVLVKIPQPGKDPRAGEPSFAAQVASHLATIANRLRVSRARYVANHSWAAGVSLQPKVKVVKVEKTDGRTLVQRRADKAWALYQRAKKEREAAERREKQWLAKVRYYERTLSKKRAPAKVDDLRAALDEAQAVFDAE